MLSETVNKKTSGNSFPFVTMISLLAAPFSRGKKTIDCQSRQVNRFPLNANLLQRDEDSF